MSIRKIMAIFLKQLKETGKNKEVLLQFLMFPLIAFLMSYFIELKDMPQNYFVILFATMFVGMAPLTSIAAIISEEKEKNTLRILMMSNVKASEYLLGIGSYIFLACMAGTAVFAMTGHYSGLKLVEFVCIMAVGIIISILLGATIGITSRNQMGATSVTVPVMLVLSFLPMLAAFNDKIKLVSQFLYSQQVQNRINDLGSNVTWQSVTVLMVNFLVVACLFFTVYRKRNFAS